MRDAFPPPMCVGLHSFICVWKRRYADVRAGTQAPPLRISFGWIARGAVLFVGKTVYMNQHHRCCTFVSPGLPPIGGYPGESRGGEPMPSALYFLKSICMRGIIHSPRVVMMCDEKKYNPQGGSLLACIVTQGRLRCTCQPCAIESITATR